MHPDPDSLLDVSVHAGPGASEDVSDLVTGKRKRKTIDYKVRLARCQQARFCCQLLSDSFHQTMHHALLTS